MQLDVLAALTLLKQEGPHLGRPHLDTLYGSNIPNMKELRCRFGRWQFLDRYTGFAIQLTYGPLQHHVKVFPYNGWVGVSQLQGIANTHQVKTFAYAASHTPDFLHRLIV